MRVVVCDDDMRLRSLISTLIEQQGDEVIAETDNAVEVLDLVRRFKPDVVVLDHALRAGTGRAVLAEIQADHDLRCHVVMFSAYPDAGIVEGPDVTVVDKPDFARLETVLQRLALGGESEEAADRRQRQQTQDGQQLRPRGGDVADDPHGFFVALNAAQPGDAVLAASVDAPTEALLMDLARMARATVRAQDWLLVRNRSIAVLLVGGMPEAAASVTARLERAWRASPNTDRALRVAPARLGPVDVPGDAFLSVCAEVEAQG